MLFFICISWTGFESRVRVDGLGLGFNNYILQIVALIKVVALILISLLKAMFLLFVNDM